MVKRPILKEYIDKAKSITDAENAFLDELERRGFERTMTPDEGIMLTEASSRGRGTSRIDPGKLIERVIIRGIQTQEQTGIMPSISSEMVKTSELAEGVLSTIRNINDASKLTEFLFGKVGNQIELYLTQQTELRGIINKDAGLTGKFSEDLREELTEANIPLLRLGIGFSDLVAAQKSLISDTGRFLGLNRETWAEAGEAAKAYVGELSSLVSMYPSFERVGIGASNVAKEILIAGNRTISLGLQSQKIITELNTNLGKINEYGFKSGVQGLTEMVRKSTEFRMNMSETFRIAEQVFDPDKAINLSANLQAIGGAIGDFNDPLRLMYMATNDVEGLQDALIGVAGSLATYNEEQGRFEITGINLRRARALANELGVEYNELAKGAIAAAERSSAATAMMASGLDLDDDTKRFLTNISTMKDGQMTIQLQGDEMRRIFGTNEIALEKLTENQLNQLKVYQKELEGLTAEQIISEQLTVTQNIDRNLSFLTAVARVNVMKQGQNTLNEVIKILGYNPDDLRKDIINISNKVASGLGVNNVTGSVGSPQSINPPTQLRRISPMNNDSKDVTITQNIKITSNGPNSDDLKELLEGKIEEIVNNREYISVDIK